MEYNIQALFDLLLTEKWNAQKYGRRIESSSGADMFLMIWHDKPAFRFIVSQKERLSLQNISPRNGFEIMFEEEGLPTGEVACIILPRSNGDNVLFIDFVRDLAIAGGEASTDSAIRNLIGRLSQWAAFFDKCPNGILSEPQQLGLFGELWFLRIFLGKGAIGIIDNWKGPEAATKDFVFNSFAVEIKSTIRSDTNRMRISDENQLDDTGFGKLMLCNFIFARDELDGYTLPELIEEIREDLHSHNLELARFNELVESAGYRDVFSEMYDKSFSLENMFYYDVRDDFPRITPKNLNKGIRSVSYSIELSLCSSFLMDYSQAETMIMSGVDGNEQHWIVL